MNNTFANFTMSSSINDVKETFETEKAIFDWFLKAPMWQQTFLLIVFLITVITFIGWVIYQCIKCCREKKIETRNHEEKRKFNKEMQIKERLIELEKKKLSSEEKKLKYEYGKFGV